MLNLTSHSRIGMLFAAVVALALNGCASTQTRDADQEPLADALRGISLTEAHQQADADDRVLLVFGTASWCGPCQRMKADTWTHPQVRDWVDRHGLVYYLDIDEQDDLRRALEINAFPRTIAFKGGEEIARASGYHGPEAFLDWLHALPVGEVARR